MASKRNIWNWIIVNTNQFSQLRFGTWASRYNLSPEKKYNGIFYFFKYGPTPASFVLFFHCEAFDNNDLQTWHSVETFLHLWQIVFAFQANLSSREGILGRCHLALQDREVTIITPTIEDTMFLLKQRYLLISLQASRFQVSSFLEHTQPIKWEIRTHEWMPLGWKKSSYRCFSGTIALRKRKRERERKQIDESSYLAWSSWSSP